MQLRSSLFVCVLFFLAFIVGIAAAFLSSRSMVTLMRDVGDAPIGVSKVPLHRFVRIAGVLVSRSDKDAVVDIIDVYDHSLSRRVSVHVTDTMEALSAGDPVFVDIERKPGPITARYVSKRTI